jgi:hypothetical protein
MEAMVLTQLFIRHDLYATSRRAAVALLCGAALAGVLTTLALSLPDLIGPSGTPLSLLVAATTVATIVWAAGMGIVGGPLWVFADRHHVRGAGAAIVIGGLTPSLTSLTWAVITDLIGGEFSSSMDGVARFVNGHRTLQGWLDSLQFAGLLALAGCAVGYLVWRVAYRPIPVSAEVF